MQLTNRTVLITGGGSGIGGGLAKAFHALGNKVIITGRRTQTLQEFASSHRGMDIFTLDVANESDIKKLFEEVSLKYPTLDVLVNNAGVMKWYDFAKPETLDAGLYEELDINLKGTIGMTATFLPLLTKQKEATIVNVSSGLAYLPLSSAPVYCATKAALHSFSESLRHQLRNSGVGVIEVAPPAVKTDLGRGPNVPSGEFPTISLDKFVELTMKALASRATELPIGQSKMLKWGSRFLPSVFFGFLNSSRR